VTSRRRATYWMPFSDGAVPLVHAASASSRLFVASIRETEVGRVYEGFTVTRMIFNVTASSVSSGNDNVITLGVILLPADIALGTVLPSVDQLSDWLWQEEHVVGLTASGAEIRFSRDIRSQRKSRGGDTELWFYATNRDTGNAVTIHRSGRVLIKRA